MPLKTITAENNEETIYTIENIFEMITSLLYDNLKLDIDNKHINTVRQITIIMQLATLLEILLIHDEYSTFLFSKIETTKIVAVIITNAII